MGDEQGSFKQMAKYMDINDESLNLIMLLIDMHMLNDKEI